jgi:hypothetical protein
MAAPDKGYIRNKLCYFDVSDKRNVLISLLPSTTVSAIKAANSLHPAA